MKTLHILIVLLLLPFLGKAQNYIQMNNMATNRLVQQNMQRMNMDNMQMMMRNSNYNFPTTENKLFKEEKRKKKLEEKTAKLNVALKTNQEKLYAIKNNSENSKNPDLQINIEKYEQKVAKSEEKLNNANTKLDSNSKKIEELKKQIETEKLKQEELAKKKEEDKKMKQLELEEKQAKKSLNKKQKIKYISNPTKFKTVGFVVL